MTGALAAAAAHDAAGDHDGAINELARAAHAGDIDAMAELGKRLVAGDRAPLLAEDGARLLFDAMRAGSAEAALRLAVMAAVGAHVQQSWGRALELLVRAAESGSESARGQLRVLAARDGSVAPGEDWRRVAASIDLTAWLAPRPGVTLHDSPPVRSFPDFVPGAACDWVIGRCRGRLKRALIYDPAHGRDIADEMRTNSATGFDLTDVDLVQVAIQQRIAGAVGMPVQNMEGPTVLHYEPGQQITEHYDFVNPQIPNYENEIAQRGERIITFLVYLNGDYEGGETEFPLLGVRHKGRRGDGLLFANALPNGRPDTRSVHAGRPPTSGEKWVAAQFVRGRAVLNARAEHVG